jgi:small-conductance mechanosensitive channel
MRSVNGDATLLVAGAAVGAFAVAQLARLLVLGVSRLRHSAWLARVPPACHRPFTAVLGSVAVRSALPHTDVSRPVLDPLQHAALLAVVAASAWLAVKVLWLAGDLAFAHVRVDVADNRRARRVRTQITLLRRMTALVVTVIAVASMLLTFDGARAAGTSLLASAGVLGVVAGVAAQSTLGNVFAGLQLAFTDALRLDDVVVVQDEWGRVEDITLTYVVLALWDQRRLVLPTAYFTTTPFENWTRTESRVLGEVLVHVDHATPVEPLRQAAQRIVEGSPLWDRKDWVLQVVDTTPSTMVVRVLASAADAPSAYDLRCEVRERLIGYLAMHHPGSLPRVRHTEVVEPARGPGGVPADLLEPGRGRTHFSS